MEKLHKESTACRKTRVEISCNATPNMRLWCEQAIEMQSGEKRERACLERIYECEYAYENIYEYIFESVRHI